MPEASMIREFDPALGDPAPGNRPVKDEELTEIAESIRREGQLVPGIACRHPTDPKRHIRAAGERRARACQIIGIPWRAEWIDRVFAKKDFIKTRVGENWHRKNASWAEMCEDVSMLMEECNFSTWSEVAAELGLSIPTISRIASPRHFTPEQRERAKILVPAACWLIAPLKPELREQALDFATRAGVDGRLPTRDAVARLVAQLKQGSGKPGRASRPKRLRFRVDGRRVELEVLPGDTPDMLVKTLTAASTRVGDHRKLPIEAVLAALTEKNRSAS